MKRVLSILCLSICTSITLSINAQTKLIEDFPASVHGLAFDENGVLYFSDTYSRLATVSKVYTLNPPYTGKPMETGISGKSIAGLLWHRKQLYVACLNKDEVRIYNEDLEFQESYHVEEPWAFSANSKKVLVLTHSGSVGTLSKRGKVQYFLNDLKNASDLAYQEEVGLWISKKQNGQQATVSMYDVYGTESDTVDIDLISPEHLAVSPKQSIYVTDSKANKIYKIRPSLHLSVVNDTLNSPLCIGISEDGTVAINANHNDGVLLIFKD